MLRHQLAVAERERPRAHSRLTWPDRALPALLAGTRPIDRLAAMRLIVTPAAILRSACPVGDHALSLAHHRRRGPLAEATVGPGGRVRHAPPPAPQHPAEDAS
jgi:hypothetical protein